MPTKTPTPTLTPTPTDIYYNDCNLDGVEIVDIVQPSSVYVHNGSNCPVNFKDWFIGVPGQFKYDSKIAFDTVIPVGATLIVETENIWTTFNCARLYSPLPYMVGHDTYCQESPSVEITGMEFSNVNGAQTISYKNTGTLSLFPNGWILESSTWVWRWDWYSQAEFTPNGGRSMLVVPPYNEHDCLRMYTDFGVLLDTYCY